MHRFDTEQSAIAEGLIWASMLVVVLERAITHAAQLALGIELSTQRAASCAKRVLDNILRCLLSNVSALAGVVLRACVFLGENSRRAHPARDRLAVAANAAARIERAAAKVGLSASRALRAA